MQNKKQNRNSIRSNLTAFRQVCQLIPAHLVRKLARQTGAEKRARSFTNWSHVVSMLYAQLTHAIGLNDVCDGLRNHTKKLGAVRGAKPPSKNGLSHANQVRPAIMVERLFWEVLDHLQNLRPEFGYGRKRKGLPRRFKKVIHAVDSTTIELVAHSMDWAQHRRRKAAAKLHMRIGVQSMLPNFAVIGSAREHDDTRAVEVCAGIRSGEIVVFDRAYVNFKHLYALTERDVFWVTRAKSNMNYRVKKKRLKKPAGNILRDDLIVLRTDSVREKYPEVLRRIEAIVEVNGREVVMVFLTNNLEWSPKSVCDLYQARWSIEVFFKQIKQVLKLHGFLGHSANAVKWQIWSALLLYVLLRFYAHLSSWTHSFTRLFTVIRGVVWDRWDLLDLLKSYGTAGGCFELHTAPREAYLPGMAP